MLIQDAKTKKLITLYFICQGYGVTGKRYCTEWKDSELYQKYIKPSTVEFIEDPHRPGNWFEYDKERPKILPEWFLNEPKVQLRGYPYLKLERASR